MIIRERIIKRLKGFSAIEICVVGAILTVFLIPVFTLMSQGSSGTIRNRNEIIAQQYASNYIAYCNVETFDGIQKRRVDEDRLRLEEGSDQVFPFRQVRRRLSAHGRVRHGQKRGGDLDEPGAPHVDGRGKAGQVLLHRGKRVELFELVTGKAERCSQLFLKRLGFHPRGNEYWFFRINQVIEDKSLVSTIRKDARELKYSPYIIDIESNVG